MSNWDAWGQLMGMFNMAVDEDGQYVAPALRPTITLDEWELTTDMAASSVGGLFDQFIALATTRWQKGVDEYRGGDESLPFTDDPLEEILAETADIYAYGKVAEEQKLLSPTETDQLNCLAYDTFKLVTRIRQAHQEKHDQEVSRLEKEVRKEKASQEESIQEEGSS